MARIIDRVLARIVPKATASACWGGDVCWNGGKYWKYCCPDSGCSMVYLGTCN